MTETASVSPDAARAKPPVVGGQVGGPAMCGAQRQGHFKCLGTCRKTLIVQPSH